MRKNDVYWNEEQGVTLTIESVSENWVTAIDQDDEGVVLPKRNLYANYDKIANAIS